MCGGGKIFLANISKREQKCSDLKNFAQLYYRKKQQLLNIFVLASAYLFQVKWKKHVHMIEQEKEDQMEK